VLSGGVGFGPMLVWVWPASMPASCGTQLVSFVIPQQQQQVSPQVKTAVHTQVTGRRQGKGGRLVPPACGVSATCHTTVSQHVSVLRCCPLQAVLCWQCVWSGHAQRWAGGRRLCGSYRRSCVAGFVGMCSLHCWALRPPLLAGWQGCGMQTGLHPFQQVHKRLLLCEADADDTQSCCRMCGGGSAGLRV